MSNASPRRLPFALVLFVVAGCLHPVREEADQRVCELAGHPLDLAELAVAPAPKPAAQAAGARPANQDPDCEPGGKLPETLLKIPPELPGADAPPIQLPSFDPKCRPQLRRAVEQLFPPLPPLSPDPPTVPGPDGHPLTLADLQRLAMSNNPAIRQAAADVVSAQGAAIQAGVYPNPTFGYQGDTMGTAGGAGYQGIVLEQTIKTAGKLKLAQAAAELDVRNAELALRKAQYDVAGQVRAGYFAVLVARENVKASRALVRFAEAIYAPLVANLKEGQVAAYEPMQFRVLAVQARAALVQALNRYTSAWKQLAAATGLPALPPTDLAGRADLALPVFDYDKTLAHVLAEHTDVHTAENTIQKARYYLRLAQVTPVPDVDVQVIVQKDNTGPPFEISPSLHVTVPVPVWDQNHGGIQQAQANLLHAVEEPHRVRTELTTRLTDAFERYQNNHIILGYYRDQILPDQVRVFRSVYLRYRTEGTLNFIDISTAQQNLATSITTYLTTLGSLWQSVSDVATLLQTDDIFQWVQEGCPAKASPLEQLLELPCSHPCSPLQDPGLKGANAFWPLATAPAPQVRRMPPTLKLETDPLPTPRPVEPAIPPGDGR
jgi:cobalt-zinc-cadmium efflux system outer membrane protein